MKNVKMTRRKFIKNFITSGLGVFGLSGGGYVYARYIEPTRLTIKKHILEHPLIPQGLDQLKIIQFSDTHLGFHYTLNQLERLIQTINQQEADLILFTGDLVDEPQTYAFTKELPELLSRLHAPLGKYWIYGNHDHGGYGTEKVAEVMAAGGFHLLQNQNVSVSNGADSFMLSGMDDVMLGKPDIDKTLEHIDPSSFSILMVHEPDIADQIKHTSVDVQLSGHSHGGQVQLPFYGYLVTPPYAEKYVEGHYLLNNQLDLFVSRGIGTTRLPYRFLCCPEISVFRLKSKQM